MLTLSTQAHAQSDEPPIRTTADPARQHQLERIALGTLASLGTSSLVVSLPLFFVGINARPSGGVFEATMISGAVTAVLLSPLSYVGAGMLTHGRGSYLAALGGMVGGAVLGFVPIPIGLAGPSFQLGGYIAATSVLAPLFGFAGQALAYELTQRSFSSSAATSRAPVLLWPSVTAGNNSATLSLGGSFG